MPATAAQLANLVPLTSETARRWHSASMEARKRNKALRILNNEKNCDEVTKKELVTMARDALSRVVALENKLAKGGRPRNDGIQPGFRKVEKAGKLIRKSEKAKAQSEPHRDSHLLDDLTPPSLARPG